MTIDGWLLIDKSVGISSFQSISKFKRALGAKIGHCGTLDPFASGFLLVAVGKATRLVEYAMALKKDYTFTVKWGVATDSDDLTGQVTQTCEHTPTQIEILAKMDDFLGEISQTPPIFSAIKVNGRRAYDYARKGDEVVLQPRAVSLEKFSLISHNQSESTFNIISSKGFYVRSLARDLAKSLGTLAHVITLRRNVSGIFENEELISDEKEKDFLHKSEFYDYLLSRILPLDYVLDDIPVYNLEQSEASKLKNGQVIGCSTLFENNSKIAVKSDGKLLALCTVLDSYLKPTKVF